MSKPINVLILEDRVADAELLIYELESAGYTPTWKRVQTELEFLAEIENLPDVILSDYSMPQFSGLRAAKLLKESGLNIPFILISGTVGEDAAVEAMQYGATDYLLKDRMGRLGIAVERALEQSRVRAERDTAEEGLRKAGALQDAIFKSAYFSCIATDAKGVVQIFNVGAQRILGYTADEVVNKITPAHFHDPEEVIARAAALSLEFATPIAPGFEALVFKAARGIEDIYELTKIRKDGSRFPAVVSVTALRDAHDAIIGYLLIGTDNTARKQAEEARRTSDARYAALFECAPDGIVIADPNSYYLDANGSMCRMLGYTRDEFIGLHASNIVADMEIPQIVQALGVIEAKSVYRREWQFRRKDGSVFDADVIATKMPDGNLLGMIRDVTERKRADKLAADALRELNDVRSAIDQHALVAITDPKGKITYVNDRFCAISKYPREELLGQDHRMISSGFHSKEFIQGIWLTISEGHVWKGEIKNKARDGTFYWVDTTIVPYLGEDGKPTQYIAIRADITERKHFELAVEKASRMKSEFLANMSHELRTPLNGIIGFAEFIVDGKPGPLNPKQKEYLGDILNSGRHLLQLINDVLDLAKIEAGRMELNLETYPLRKAIEEVCAVAAAIAQKKKIALKVQIAAGLNSVMLDQQKFKQIIYNLLSNAIKFTDNGGQVEIAASYAGPGHFCVAVRDTGIGIKSEDMPRLFKEFEQLDAGMTRRFEGTGLGLALTKKLVECQGGSISVESEPGKGSTFSVVLPLETMKEAA